MKIYLKKNIPVRLISLLKSYINEYNLIKKNICFLILEIKLFLVGFCFMIFNKKFKNKGVNIHVPYDLTDFKFRKRFLLNNYEVEEAKYLDKYLSNDAKVLELGGCIGYISCLINKKLIDKTQQVTLEANPKLIKWILKNREENKCCYSVENTIISREKENIFYYHNLIVGGSVKRKTDHKTIVKGVDIDYLKRKYNIAFDTLVMDIEGGELDFIKNFKESLGEFKRIFLEVHPFANILTEEEAKTCENLLKQIGFNLILRDGNFQIWDKN